MEMRAEGNNGSLKVSPHYLDYTLGGGKFQQISWSTAVEDKSGTNANFETKSNSRKRWTFVYLQLNTTRGQAVKHNKPGWATYWGDGG